MSAALDQSSAAPVTPSTLARRTLLRRFAALGAGSVTFQRALADETAKTGRLTDAQISNAEWIAGLTLSQADREVLIRSGESLLAELQQQ